MKQIYARNDYRIYADPGERRASIVKGTSTLNVSLEELTPLSPVAAKHLRMMGCDPANYLNIGHTNQVILRDAAVAWQHALDMAAGISRRKDTCMISSFWSSVAGLLELREAEDSFAACQRTASLMFEYGERSAPPATLLDLRHKYPRAAAYILAEQHAFTANEALAARARQALHIIASNGDLERALELIPRTVPNPQLNALRRSPGDDNPPNAG